MCLISHSISGSVPVYTSEVISFTSLAHSDSSTMAKRSLSLTTNCVSVSPPFSTCYVEVITSGIFFTFHWFEKIINQETTECCRSLIPKSSTTCLRANVELLEHCTPPNRCEVLRNCSIETLTGHRDHKAFLFFSGIFILLYLASMSVIAAYGNCQKQIKTSNNLLLRSGPWWHCLFKLIPCKVTAQSKTTQTLAGFFSVTTAWWGKYLFLHHCPIALQIQA